MGGYDTIDLQTDVVLTAALPIIDTAIVLNANGHTLDGNDSFRVFTIQRPGQFTLNNASVAGGNSDVHAGGIWNAGFPNEEEPATRIINNSTISGNTSDENVGGIYIREGCVTINHSTITNNSADQNGGGLFVTQNGTAELNVSLIAGNGAAANEITLCTKVSIIHTS